MASFENLTIKDLLAKLRKVDSYENVSGQQLESILETLSAFKTTPKAKPKPKSTLTLKKSTSKAEAKGKSEHELKSATPEPILNLYQVDKLQEIVVAKIMKGMKRVTG